MLISLIISPFSADFLIIFSILSEITTFVYVCIRPANSLGLSVLSALVE